MKDLAKALNDYIALRRVLGFQVDQMTRLLPRFVRFAEQENATHITTNLAIRWAQEDPAASSVVHSRRLSVVRSFAAWRHAQDPLTEIPPVGILPWQYQRPTPYICSEEEIQSIVQCAANLPSKRGIRGLTNATIFGLLAVTGMRIGEAVAIDRDDVDLRTGVLAIRAGKGGKSRFVPIHPTTNEALEDYSTKRDALVAEVRMGTPAFFVSERGDRMAARSASRNFAKVSHKLGLGPPVEPGRCRRPRLHDLRHRFAVSTLISWYRSGIDVDREIPKLATYLGHRSPTHVYWYLQAVPELLELVTARSRHPTPGGAS